MDALSDKLMTPFIAEIAQRLHACDELDISDETAELLCSMSVATMDR